MTVTEIAAIIAIPVGVCALIAYGHAFWRWLKSQWQGDDPPAA